VKCRSLVGSEIGTLSDPTSPCESVNQQEQEGSTGERCEERPEYPIGFDPEEAQDSTPDHTTDDTHHNIAQDAQLITLNQPVSQRTSQTTNDNPDDPYPECPQDTRHNKRLNHLLYSPFDLKFLWMYQEFFSFT
jgi:hypothetical protein